MHGEPFCYIPPRKMPWQVLKEIYYVLFTELRTTVNVE